MIQVGVRCQSTIRDILYMRTVSLHRNRLLWIATLPVDCAKLHHRWLSTLADLAMTKLAVSRRAAATHTATCRIAYQSVLQRRCRWVPLTIAAATAAAVFPAVVANAIFAAC